ncbi:MAG: hypothetical protein LLF98_01960 [Clostridium sp.]|uniref:hypothetical protein n=1 Tax=Clostridium sp. TaxID=1506 RepID=UPI0025C4FE5A|nr:hypothetical protein [Clostridium sp.]MCE5220046.1 hypothetical protein [Clostridium sp.]
MWKELLSGSEIRISTLAFLLITTAVVYLFICLFSILTSYKIPELQFILDSIKGVMGFLTAGVIGNGCVSVGKGFVEAKSGISKEGE